MTNPIADSFGEVSAGKEVLTPEHRVAASVDDPSILRLLADQAEAEADLTAAARQLHELLIARGDAELTAAIRRWSQGLTRIVDLGAAVNSAKAGAAK